MPHREPRPSPQVRVAAMQTRGIPRCQCRHTDSRPPSAFFVGRFRCVFAWCRSVSVADQRVQHETCEDGHDSKSKQAPARRVVGVANIRHKTFESRRVSSSRVRHHSGFETMTSQVVVVLYKFQSSSSTAYDWEVVVVSSQVLLPKEARFRHLQQRHRRHSEALAAKAAAAAAFAATLYFRRRSCVQRAHPTTSFPRKSGILLPRWCIESSMGPTPARHSRPA